MSEQISPTSYNTPSIFLLNAISREACRADLLDHFKIVREDGKPTLVNVEMKINGVEVDFSATVNDMWKRLSSTFEEKVLEKAKELIRETRSDRFNEIVQQSERILLRDLEALFQTEFED